MRRVPAHFCRRNLLTRSAVVRDRLDAQFADLIEVREVDCLGHCRLCAERAYCLIGGLQFSDEDAEALWARVSDICTRVREVE